VPGQAVIVIATPAHREGLQNRVAVKAISVAAARSSDQIILLDAEEIMAYSSSTSGPSDHRTRQRTDPQGTGVWRDGRSHARGDDQARTSVGGLLPRSAVLAVLGYPKSGMISPRDGPRRA
jgi:hypothetical protein